MKKKEIKKINFKDINSRLNYVLKKDKELNPDYIKEVIKSDVYYMLNNYFDVDFFDINIKIDVDDSKKYNIKIEALGDRLKIMKKLID